MQSLNPKTREGCFKAASTQDLDKVQPSLFVYGKNKNMAKPVAHTTGATQNG